MFGSDVVRRYTGFTNLPLVVALAGQSDWTLFYEEMPTLPVWRLNCNNYYGEACVIIFWLFFSGILFTDRFT